MVFAGIKKEHERHDLIAYLREASGAGPAPGPAAGAAAAPPPEVKKEKKAPKAPKAAPPPPIVVTPVATPPAVPAPTQAKPTTLKAPVRTSSNPQIAALEAEMAKLEAARDALLKFRS